MPGANPTKPYATNLLNLMAVIERLEALQGAYTLAEELPVVSPGSGSGCPLWRWRVDLAQHLPEIFHPDRTARLAGRGAGNRAGASRPRHLEAGLQRDIKAFFGDYRLAMEEGKALLFAAGRPETITEASREAAEQGLGWLEESESLQQIPLSQRRDAELRRATSL